MAKIKHIFGFQTFWILKLQIRDCKSVLLLLLLFLFFFFLITVRIYSPIIFLYGSQFTTVFLKLRFPEWNMLFWM